MARFLTLFILGASFLFFRPADAFAVSESLCVDDFLCLCSGSDGTNDISQTFENSVRSIATCKTTCGSIGNSRNATSMTYTLQCKTANGQPFIPDRGTGNALENADRGEDQCVGGYVCTCNGHTETTDVRQTFTSGVESVGACLTACGTLGSSKGANFMTYQLQCRDRFGALLIPENGAGSALTSTLNAPVTTNEPKKDAIIPYLNVPIPGLDFTNAVTMDTATGRVSSNLIGLYVQAAYRYLLGAGALIAVVMLMAGGLQYMTSRGSPKAVDKGKERIRNAAVGIIILLLAYNIAFLISPDTVTFHALSIRRLDREDLPTSEETEDALAKNPPGSTYAYSGDLTAVLGPRLVVKTTENAIDRDTLEALNLAAEAYYSTTGDKVLITSASRTLEHQARLFYDSCLSGKTKCVACDPTGSSYGRSSVITKANGRYVLTGTLAGVTDRAKIISELAANGDAGNCPHTSNVAVDAWPATGHRAGYQHDVKRMQDLITVFTQNGFCRLSNEAWHFELDKNKRSERSCSTNNNTTNTGSKSTSGCKIYDFDDLYCVEFDTITD